MLTYRFENTEQLVKFITAMPEFLTWETMTCRFSTTNGLNIDMNTSIVDTSGKSNFIELQFLLPTINNFYQTIVASNYAELNVEIKLRLPSIFKNKYDPDNEYEGFYIHAHSDNLLSMVSTSHLERSREAGLQPITSWEEYIAGLYHEFVQKSRKQEI